MADTPSNPVDLTHSSAERRAMLVLGAVYVLVASVVKASLPFFDLTDFWVPACRLILEGRPQDIYSIRLEAFGQSFPNSYPPLFFAILTPFVAIADGLGLSYGGYTPGAVGEGWGASVVGLPLVLADLVLAWLLCQAARKRLPASGDRLWFFAILLVQMPIWYSSVRVQHHESMLLTALIGAVLCVERDRRGWAVALLGLALCFKATAILAIPAVAFAFLRSGKKGAALAAATVPLAMVLGMLAPWLLARPERTLDALLRFESVRPIFGVATAKLVMGTGLEEAAVRFSNAAMILACTALSAVLIARGKSLRQTLACVFLAGLVLARWVYPHYLLVPCGLLLAWELTRPSFPRLSLLATGAMWALQSPYFPELTLESGPAVKVRAAIWGLGLVVLAVHVARQRDSPVLTGENGRPP